MKITLMLLTLFLADIASAQSALPDFLLGTWKRDNKEIYEHWDKLNENTLKGFSYKIKEGQMVLSEYLDISRTKNEVVYTASVIGQNDGKSIGFKLVKTDSSFVFENFNHDFPKRIVYQKLTDTEVFVQASDGKQNGFAFKMKKQHVKPAAKDSAAPNPNYDRALAEKLGADDYGMKKYILVVLKTGTNQTTDKAFVSEAFKRHLENINRLVKEEKLIVAGPFGKNGNNYRGIFILNHIATPEEARELLQTDPAVKAGLLEADLYNWYGSAALPEYLEFSDKVWKLKP
jgi:uncharacterized protein YciI